MPTDKEEKIEYGMLYEVTESMLAGKNLEEEGRRVVVEKGEIIEFRCFANANFRTVDGLYLVVECDYFLEHTKPFAKILENIKFRNQNSLEEILNAKLYEPIKETT